MANKHTNVAQISFDVSYSDWEEVGSLMRAIEDLNCSNKYEENIWLCDSCCDERMEED